MTDTTIDERQAARWAQEETLRRLLNETAVSNQLLERFVENKLSKEELDTLKKNVDATKDLGSVTTAELRRLGGRYDDSLKRAYDDLGKSLSGSFRDFAGSVENLGRRGLLGSLQGASEDASKRLFLMSHKMTGFEKRLSFATAGLLTFGSLLITGWEIVSDLNKNYLTLYENGINFAQGLRGMTQATGDLGITTEQLISIFTQHGEVIALLGTDRAVRLGKEFVRLNRGMGELGLTNAQASEAILEYSNLTRLSGRLSKMTNAELVQGTAEYYKELNLVTALTGRNRKEIQKSIEARAKEPDFQVMFKALPDTAKKALESSLVPMERLGEAGSDIVRKSLINMLSGKGLATLPKDIVGLINLADIDEPLYAMAAKLNAGNQNIEAELDEIASKLGSDELAEYLQTYIGATGTIGDITKLFGSLQPGLKNYDQIMQSLREQAEKLALAEVGATDQTILSTVTEQKFEELKKQYIKETAARNKLESETQNTLNQASAKLTEVFNTLVVDVMQPMLPVLTTFGDVIILLSNGFKGLLDVISYLPRSVGGMFGIKAGAPAETNAEGDVVTPREPDWADTATSIGVTGLAGAFLYNRRRRKRRARQQDKEQQRTPESPAQTAMDLMGGPPTGPLTTGMKAIAEAGPTLGPSLTGAATGLRAFANPQILIGAGILAGAVTALGAGIAGATWIMGKSLPSLADGLTSFTDIDGTKLGEVGMGMIKIGGGLAAMGVGEVASALGSIASGITSLWQADPISKLMRFAEISGPLAEAAESMEKFGTSYPNAIRMLNEVELGSAATDAMDQIKSLLGSDMSTLFGGQPPIIGQISDLASSIGSLSQNANQLTTGVRAANAQLEVGTTRIESTTLDITDKTLEFYDTAKSNYQSMVMLLQTVNTKLDTLDKSTRDQTDELTRTIGRNSNSVFGR